MRKLPTMKTLLAISCISASAAAQSNNPAPGSTAPASTAVTPAPAPQSPVPTAVDAPPATRPVRTHSVPGAFFASVELGVGYLGTHEDTAVDFGAAGPAVDFAVRLGATIAPQWVLYGELGVYEVSNPTISSGTTSVETQNVKLTNLWIGPGVTYYISPLNFYVGTSLALSRTVIDVPDAKTTYNTNLGPAVGVHVGKEWWVADRMAISLSAQAFWASVKDSEGDGTVTSRAFSLAVSTNYN